MWARSQTSGDWSGEYCAVSCSSVRPARSASVRSRARTSSVGDTELCEPLEGERGNHRPLPDGGADTLDRAVADVARREKPDPARLERERVAVEFPALPREPLVRFELLPGQDVAVAVGEDVLSLAPVGMR